MKKLILLLAVFAVAACSKQDLKQMEDKMQAESAAMGEEAEKAAEEKAEEMMTVDVVNTAIKSGGFTTLVALINAADLADTLKGEGPFTVFAPTDDAFKALPDGTVAGLMDPSAKDKVREILLNHVVSGTVTSATAETKELSTMAGKPVMLEKGEDGSLKFGGAVVTTADIEATNGVVHVLNEVILPGSGDSAMK